MKTLRMLASAAVTLLMLGSSATAFAGYAPTRSTTYKCAVVNGKITDNCPGADHIVFNSFTNNPTVGDERTFLWGSVNGASHTDGVTVKDGDVVTVIGYVHNNADATKMGSAAKTIAKNVTFAVPVPTTSQANLTLTGSISVDNASPKVVTDTMTMTGANPFTLAYQSASFYHFGPDGKTTVYTPLNKSVATATGASLGDMPGSFVYSGYVLVKLQVKMPKPAPAPAPTYTCQIQAGAVNDVATISSFTYQTNGGATFKNVVVDWGDGSTSAASSTAAHQTHTYKVFGSKTITATAHFTVSGSDKTTQCKQVVTVSKPPVTPTPTPTPTPKPTPTPTPTPSPAPTPTTPVTPVAVVPKALPDTGAGNVIGIFAGVVAVATVGYRLFLSRKLARR